MNYFKDIELFSDLSEADQENLSAFCQTQTFSSWDILFKQWEIPQAMYIIASWKLLVQKQLSGWETQDVAILWEWDLVWDSIFWWATNS